MIQSTFDLFAPAPVVKLEWPEDALRRWWSKINKCGPIHPYDPEKGPCWLWLGSKHKKGYGHFGVAGKVEKAHRIAFQLHHRILLPGECALHTCDNPPCVNPAHLFAGTHVDNVADMDRKGRRGVSVGDAHGSRTHPESRAHGAANGAYTHPEKRPRGENHGNGKLTEPDVLSIRSRYAAGGITLKSLANEFGVSLQLIWLVVNRKSWRHI